MGKLLYKNYSDKDLFKEYENILNKMEKGDLTKQEYLKLEIKYEEVKKELRSRGFRI